MSPRKTTRTEPDGLEWEHVPQLVWILNTGKQEAGVKCIYRRPPAKRWTSFLLLGEYESDEELRAVALHTIAVHERGEVRRS